LFVNANDQFINLPILAQSSGFVLGYQEVLRIISNDIEVLAVVQPNHNVGLVTSIVGNEVRFNWISYGGMYIEAGDIMANLVIKVNRKRSIRRIPTFIRYEEKNQMVVVTGHRHDPNFRLALPHIAIDNEMPITILDSIIGDQIPEVTPQDTTRPGTEIITVPSQDIQASKIVNVIPNPMTDRADVTYSISEEAIVSLRLFNLLGVEIATLINAERQDAGVFRQRLVADGLPNGVYILRLETVSRGRQDTSIEKVVVNR
jgi:hypothetical protein